MRYSDDREPQGTAGMPTLDAIRKRGCTDTVVVVTRYFGGTLLGTGGLVRAYSAAAVGAISEGGLITFENYTSLKITVSYSDFQKLSGIFDECAFRTEQTVYTDSVTILGKILSNEYERLEKLLTEATSMRANIENLGEKFDF
jgi:putative IMPACT (imprinted ancient) family translation regulator